MTQSLEPLRPKYRRGDIERTDHVVSCGEFRQTAENAADNHESGKRRKQEDADAGEPADADAGTELVPVELILYVSVFIGIAGRDLHSLPDRTEDGTRARAECCGGGNADDDRSDSAVRISEADRIVPA